MKVNIYFMKNIQNFNKHTSRPIKESDYNEDDWELNYYDEIINDLYRDYLSKRRSLHAGEMCDKEDFKAGAMSVIKRLSGEFDQVELKSMIDR